MSTPTEAEIQNQIAGEVQLFEITREFSGVNAENWNAQEDTLVQLLESDRPAIITSAIARARARIDGVFGDAEAMISPSLIDYAKFFDLPERDPQSIFTRLFEEFADSLRRVTSRQFTFQLPVAAGPNIGDGLIRRLNIDERGFDIENQHPDAKTAECITDQSTGAREHEEVFEFRGGTAERDRLIITGSGRTSLIKAQSARDSLLLNPSFSQFSGTVTPPISTPTAITSWTVLTSIANFRIDEGLFYRDFQGDTTPRSVQLLANDRLTQALSLRNTALERSRPYYLQVAANRNSTGADGTLTIRLGSNSASVVLTTQPATGWFLLTLALDTNLWPRNFNQDPLDVQIEWSGRTTGDLHVDDVLLIPSTQFDGSWYWIIGGATPFLLTDEFTWTDTAVESVLQRWLWRTFGRYLPHATGGAITWVDP